MKIISHNVNGLKSYGEKGALQDLISTFDPDVLCLQETKCSESMVGYWASDYNYDYVPFSNSNHWKRGYAGVTTWIKESLLSDLVEVTYPNLQKEYGQGRVITLQFDKFYLVNVYTLNSGDKDDLRKSWDITFRNYIKTLSKPVIIVGDFNVVPSELDYWGNYQNSIDSMPGLKTFELENLNKLETECDLVDSYRHLQPSTRAYSWYSYQGGARAKNHGWRIDLALVSESLLPKIIESQVFSKFEGSDHTPIGIVI